jgi:hypothetical protein
LSISDPVGALAFSAMIVFSREVFVCKCSTDVRRDDPEAAEMARAMRFISGSEADFERLDRAHHDGPHIEDFRMRLARGEHWMVGLVDDRIVTYTWLHTRDATEYPYLPGCRFGLASDVGYGYDAWTPPELRGAGLRRRAFLEELNILRERGIGWEASFFVKHQLEGATRSLGKVGIVIEPLWKVSLQRDRTLLAEKLAAADTSTWPLFDATTTVPASTR